MNRGSIPPRSLGAEHSEGHDNARCHPPRAVTLACWCAAALMLFFSTEARACGGCFAPPQTVSAVTGHRMVFAVSEDRTVLWDQFSYSGAPEDFAWVLPVAKGAYLEVAEQGFFDALEELTAVRVTAPPLNCAQSESGGGCGSFESADSTSLSGVAAEPSVRIVFSATVGPYETVTLSSDDPDALTEWLEGNGYSIPRNIEPIIAAYVEEGADFIALRLAPDEGVDAMQPVRVVTPGGEPILPLRMVAAGVGLEVDIVLYVIGEDRYTIPDLHSTEIDETEIEWDFQTNTSNYERLRDTALGEHGGFMVLTTYAQPNPLLPIVPNGAPAIPFPGSPPLPGEFPNRYIALSNQTSGPFPGEQACREAVGPYDGVVTDPCYGASEVTAPIECGPSEHGIPSSTFTCGADLTDIAAALVGMRPDRVWLTRLEMTLPRHALGMDCAVERVESTAVSNSLTARKGKNLPCEPAVFTASVANRTAHTPWFWGIVSVGFVTSLFARRRLARLGKRAPSGCLLQSGKWARGFLGLGRKHRHAPFPRVGATPGIRSSRRRDLTRGSGARCSLRAHHALERRSPVR